MTALDSIAAALLSSSLDSLLEESVLPAANGAAAAQVGTSGMPQAAGPAAPAQAAAQVSVEASLSEIALALDAITRSGGTATPAVPGTAPLLPSAPGPVSGAGSTAAEAAGAPAAGDAPQRGAAAGGGAAPLDPARLMAQAELPAQALFRALSAAVSESGLFYEAHLAEWLGGRRGTAELMREPQARLAGGQAARGGADEEAADAYAWLDAGEGAELAASETASAAAAGQGPPAAAARADTPQAAAQPAAESSSGAAAPPRPATPFAPFSAAARALDNYAAWSSPARDMPAASVAQSDAAAVGHTSDGPPAAAAQGALMAALDPATLPLVRQQLELLASQQFRWSGEAWPGARLDWSIEPDEQQAEAAPHGSERAWRTRVTLSLPTLGTIDADLWLSGQRLAVRLRANAGGAAHLAAHSASFGARLRAAGLQLDDFSINVGDAPGARSGMALARASSLAAAAAAAYRHTVQAPQREMSLAARSAEPDDQALP